MSEITTTDDTVAKRIAFLAAYEELGPGGLTPAEIIELADLRERVRLSADFNFWTDRLRWSVVRQLP